MPDYPMLRAEPRTVAGKAVRHLRRMDITPIVVYGAHTAPLPLQARTKDVLEVMRQAGGTSLILLSVAGEPRPRTVLAREVQRHVTKLAPLHVDFLEVRADEAVTTHVPVVVEGVPPLVELGAAVMDLMVTEVAVQALPADLPATISVDASRLVRMEDTIHRRDLVAGDRVRVLGDPDELVLRLAPTRLAASVVEEEPMPASAEVPRVRETQQGKPD